MKTLIAAAFALTLISNCKAVVFEFNPAIESSDGLFDFVYRIELNEIPVVEGETLRFNTLSAYYFNGIDFVSLEIPEFDQTYFEVFHKLDPHGIRFRYEIPDDLNTPFDYATLGASTVGSDEADLLSFTVLDFLLLESLNVSSSAQVIAIGATLFKNDGTNVESFNGGALGTISIIPEPSRITHFLALVSVLAYLRSKASIHAMMGFEPQILCRKP